MGTTTGGGHDHRVGLETTVAFMNTLEHCHDRSHDHADGFHDNLDDPTAAAAWLGDRGLAHAGDIAAAASGGSAWLGRVHAARAAFREVFDAEAEGRAASAMAVDAVNAILQHPPLVLLTPGSDGCGVGHRHVGDPTDEALARLAEPLVEGIARHGTDRWRICANDECRWVFVDESRTARRRWCDMSTCGNRAKAARHRAKLREERALQILP